MPGMENTGLPPTMRGADRGSPGMAGTSAGAGSMMRRLAERGQGGQQGQGGEQQSAEMLMQGAQMMMQAAQANPSLLPIVQRAMSVLKEGVQSLASGAGGGPPPPPRGGRQRKPKAQAQSQDMSGGDEA